MGQQLRRINKIPSEGVCIWCFLHISLLSLLKDRCDINYIITYFLFIFFFSFGYSYLQSCVVFSSL